jgi:hypothetical protein
VDDTIIKLPRHDFDAGTLRMRIKPRRCGAETMLRQRRFVPDFRSRIVTTDTFTPAMIRRYTGRKQRLCWPKQAARWRRTCESVHLRHRSRLGRHCRARCQEWLWQTGTLAGTGSYSINMNRTAGVRWIDWCILRKEGCMPKDFLEASAMHTTIVISSSLAGLTAANTLARRPLGAVIELHYKLALGHLVQTPETSSTSRAQFFTG